MSVMFGGGALVASNRFSRHWYPLLHAGGDRPHPRDVATVCKRLRDAVMAAFPDPLPYWISGHDASGGPLAAAHMAVLPLIMPGDGEGSVRMVGLAIALPEEIRRSWTDSDITSWKQKRDFEGALSRLTNTRGELELRLGKLGLWKLAPDPGGSRAAPVTDFYTRASLVFRSITPVILDRHPRRSGEAAAAELEEILASSCVNSGLPRPERAFVSERCGFSGVPDARSAGKDWVLPAFLSNRLRYHVHIEFSAPVSGPVVIGAGRFAGLGLCAPVPTDLR